MKYLFAANCKVVKGFNRSLIMDLQRNRQFLVSHDLLKKIERLDTHEINDPFIDKLLEDDIVLCLNEDEVDLFPDISTDFEVPSHIQQAIIDMDNVVHDLEKILTDLEYLVCRHLEIRVYKKINTFIFSDVFSFLSESTIEAVDIYVPYDMYVRFQTDFIRELTNHTRFRLLYVHSCPDLQPDEKNEEIIYTTQAIRAETHCGQIDKFHFSTTILTYIESVNHNSCLNRKISVDKNGNIKNCPSMSQSFGNIRDTTLQQALDHPDFKKYWNVTKDQIEVCKDCEFRYICTDCRAYIENPGDMYSKPLKCGYNPYTCEWEEWSTNPLKQKAIDYYGMRDVLPEFQLKPDFVPVASPDKT